MAALAKRKPERFPPSVWARAKADYWNGMSVPRVEATHGIKACTFRARAQREGWTRSVVWAAEAAALPERAPHAPADAPSEVMEGEATAAPFVQPSSSRIVEVSLTHAVAALEKGNSVEAIRMAEAGDKVGEFAELVKLVRAREGA